MCACLDDCAALANILLLRSCDPKHQAHPRRRVVLDATAMSSSPGKRGYLQVKQGSGLGAWKPRFFVCEEGLLGCYKDNTMLSKENEYELRELVVNAKSTQYPRKQLADFAFLLDPGPGAKAGSEVHLCAENAQDKVAWIEALNLNQVLSRKKDAARTGSVAGKSPTAAAAPSSANKMAGPPFGLSKVLSVSPSSLESCLVAMPWCCHTC